MHSPYLKFNKNEGDHLRMSDENIEIYRQRYETFRHFDRLRWQMLQILVAVASATALILRSTTGSLEWWFYGLLGVALSILGFVMIRINGGIRGNALVLRKAAKSVGDEGMPDVSQKWKSVAHWIAVLVIALGAFLVVKSIFMAVCN